MAQAANDNNDIEMDDDEFDDFDLRGSLENILEQKSLKWIFVGGKGGVGKTTTSCSLALMLALKRKEEGKKILIISTDPAHNLSDAYGQQFGPQPIQINGIDNLFAMEIDPKIKFNDDSENGGFLSQFGDEQKSSLNFLSELSSQIPGIDEAMSFNELIKQVKKQDFDIIIFDTAPTGHTLRLLSFPTVLEKALNKLDGLKNKFGGLFSNFANVLNQQQNTGNNNNTNQNDMNKLGEKLEEMKKSIDEIKKTFENDDLTTFICVCIPEFLSLYETERLVQKLAKFGIDTHNIVINQVLFPEKNKNGCSECSRCKARVKMQSKYIEQFNDLYPDFHLTKIPLMSQEVRHVKKLKKFAYLLLNPYEEEYNKDDFDEDQFFKDFKDNDDDDDDNTEQKEDDNNNNNDNKPTNKEILDID